MIEKYLDQYLYLVLVKWHVIDFSWLIPIYKTWLYLLLGVGIIGIIWLTLWAVAKWYWSIIEQVEERKARKR